MSDVALVGGAAVIGGVTARKLGRVLEGLVRDRVRAGVQVDPAVVSAVRALREAGRWAPDLPGFRSASAQGSGCHLPDRSLVTACEAAQLLGVSARRVRQLVGVLLDPVSTARPMKFDRNEIEMLARNRRRR